MNKEEIINKLNAIDKEIARLKSEKIDLGKKFVSEHCPYKVDQKAKYVRVVEKNVGSWMNPKFEIVRKTEEILVCVAITLSDYNNSKCRFQFKRLRKNGELTSTFVHVPYRELEWINEFYEGNK